MKNKGTTSIGMRPKKTNSEREGAGEIPRVAGQGRGPDPETACGSSVQDREATAACRQMGDTNFTCSQFS